MIRKVFPTGLAVLLPAILTFLIVGFLINFLTKPFLGTVEASLIHFDIFHHPFLFFTGPALLHLVSKTIILISLLIVIFLIGFLGKLFLVSHIFRVTNLLHHIPFVNKIYKASQDVVHGLLSSQSSSFSQVVLVPFPTANTLSVGLVAQDSISFISQKKAIPALVPVFVPGTPNPSVGFMLMFKKEDLLFTDMKVDEAMKFIVSCGVVLSGFSIVPHQNKKGASHEKIST